MQGDVAPYKNGIESLLNDASVISILSSKPYLRIVNCNGPFKQYYRISL